MINYHFKLSNYQLRDYERNLAHSELKAIFGGRNLKKVEGGFRFVCRERPPKERLEDLTFFSEVVVTNGTGDEIIIPRQVKHEMSAKILKSRNSSQKEIYELIVNGKSNSRQLRYLTHLMHEYKGRFNPQLCKALINISNIKKGQLVLDPFLGSGTTLLECYLNGYAGVGLDLNPLAFLIAKTKVESLSLDIKTLKGDVEHVAESLKNKFANIVINDARLKNLYDSISERFTPDLGYLQKWFPTKNLFYILIIIKEICKLSDSKTRNLFLLALSDVLISLSFQDPKQLRIMRRPQNTIEMDVLNTYLNNLRQYCNVISTYQFVKPTGKTHKVKNYLGDVRNLRQDTGLKSGSVDLIVTSPPYATALPYIDTDRLSLMLLGYVNKKSLGNLESKMIGNREISFSERSSIESEFLENHSSNGLPEDVNKLIRKIYYLNSTHDVGFRRKNMAALLYKYFGDMRSAMLEMHSVLRRGSYCFMVVGCNSTTAGGEEVFIPTDDLISSIAKEIGFQIHKKILLNINSSYMIYKRNSIKRESVLVFTKAR